jgi:hypothetical protein
MLPWAGMEPVQKYSTFSITFTGTDQTCSWTASATGTGISVTSGASETGDATTTVVVASNSGYAARDGTFRHYCDGAPSVGAFIWPPFRLLSSGPGEKCAYS